jgi:hypothetical protein
MLERRFVAREKHDFVITSTLPSLHGDEIRIGEWSEGKDGTLRRISTLPPGMSMEEAERIVAARGQQPSA